MSNPKATAKVSVTQAEDDNSYNKFSYGIIIFIIVAAIIIYSFWTRDHENELQKFSMIIDYHTESYQYLDKMNNEILIIQNKLTYFENTSPNLIVKSTEIEKTIYSYLENFRYFTQDSMESLEILQDRFQQDLFNDALARLGSNVINVNSLILNISEFEEIPTAETLQKLDAMMVTVRQLNLLHLSSKESMIAEMQTEHLMNRNSFLLVLSCFVIFGILTCVLTFHRINALHTAQKNAQKETTEALDALTRADRVKNEFLAHMSHDLRTPLNSILGFSQLIEQKTHGPIGNSHYEEYITLIYHSGEKLLSLVNDILDLSRLESGEYSLQKTPLDITELAERCFQRCTATPLQELGDRFLISIGQNAPMLFSDERAVSQIMDNLITNALKYAGPSAKISIRWFVDSHGQGVLVINDTGNGIPEDHMKNVLEPFVQATAIKGSGPFVSTKSDGVGLGLHIITKLSEVLEAKFIFHSRENLGTTATFIFPETAIIDARDQSNVHHLHAQTI